MAKAALFFASMLVVSNDCADAKPFKNMQQHVIPKLRMWKKNAIAWA